jgi:hypothetical protein
MNTEKPATKPVAKPAPKPAAKPVAKEAAKPVAKEAAKPVAKEASKPVAKEATKPVAKEAAKPVAKEAAKPVAKEAAKPVAKEAAKPVSKESAKPVSKEAAKPVSKEAAKPVSKEAAKPVAKEASKPVAKEAAKPVAKEAAKPVAKEAAKPVSKPAAKPVSKPAAKPVSKQEIKKNAIPLNNHKINIIYTCFWTTFTYTGDILYDKIFNFPKYNVIQISNDIFNNSDMDETLNNADMIVSGSHIRNEYQHKMMKKYGKKTIVFISEPLDYFYKLCYDLVSKNVFRAYYGCINNSNDRIKLPFYTNLINETVINNINNYLDNVSFDEFCTKEFCSLINRHDKGNTRTIMFNKLSEIQKVNSPGNLLNNYSNASFEKEGMNNFKKRHIFGLCPENFVTNLEGYITEKMPTTCNNGNIPIYYGKLDELDTQIFNMNRVFMFDPTNTQSMNTAVSSIKDLMNDKNEAYLLYKQHPYTNTALELIEQMMNDCVTRVKQLFRDIIKD